MQCSSRPQSEELTQEMKLSQAAQLVLQLLHPPCYLVVIIIIIIVIIVVIIVIIITIASTIVLVSIQLSTIQYHAIPIPKKKNTFLQLVTPVHRERSLLTQPLGANRRTHVAEAVISPQFATDRNQFRDQPGKFLEQGGNFLVKIVRGEKGRILRRFTSTRLLLRHYIAANHNNVQAPRPIFFASIFT